MIFNYTLSVEQGDGSMNYLDWASEYREQEVILNNKISKLKGERKLQRSSYERRALEDRIYVLYGMYLECMHVRQILEGRAKKVENKKLAGA